ncbi:MAG: hypothetical protein ACRECH_11580 [Nitrososphaerales archaeon]
MDGSLDARGQRERKWLVNLPTIVLIAVIVASLILGGFASVRAAQTSTSNTQSGTVYALVVVSGNTTYTTTVTSSPCLTGQVEQVVQPIVVIMTNQTISTRSTYLTTKC